MDATAKPQRRRERRKVAGLSVVRLEMKDALGNQHRVNAGLVDILDGGLGLALETPVNSGSIVVVLGKLGENHSADHVKAVVRWCIGKADGTFRAGLEFLNFSSAFQPKEQPSANHSDTLDCYEVMQLSSIANSNTITRSYRLLALRYHPDNIDTGNSEKFIRLSEAYQILSDPIKRARYDARHRTARAVSETRRAEGNVSHLRPTVGTLGGWDAALRAL